MATRGFAATAARRALNWRFNGTTIPVDFYTRRVDQIVETFPPDLAAKAKIGVIQGDPHETPATGDPEHVEGKIGIGSVNNKKRLTSFHAYPNGTVIFSNPMLAGYNRGPELTEAGTSSLAAQTPEWQMDEAGTSSMAAQTPEWQMDDEVGMKKMWDGKKWLYWDEAAARIKYWDGSAWQWGE